MAANPTYRTTMGLAKETAFGTAIAPVAFVPVTSLTAEDKLTLLKDQGWRGSAVETYGQVPGPTSGEVSFGGDVFADTIGYPLCGILGDVATTGASAPFTTTAALLNTGTTQPTSYTLTATDAVNSRQFAGARFSEVGLKFDGGGKLEYTAKALAFISAILATPPAPSFSSLPITAGWTGVVTLGGVVVPDVVSGEVTIKRAVDAINTVDGSQAAFNNWAGPLSVEGKLTLVMEADTYRAAYVAGTPTSLQIAFSQGAGATATSLGLKCSSIILTAAPKNYGKSYIELDASFEANANTTDIGASGGYCPVKVTLQNGSAAGTYA